MLVDRTSSGFDAAPLAGFVDLSYGPDGSCDRPETRSQAVVVELPSAPSGAGAGGPARLAIRCDGGLISPIVRERADPRSPPWSFVCVCGAERQSLSSVIFGSAVALLQSPITVSLSRPQAAAQKV